MSDPRKTQPSLSPPAPTSNPISPLSRTGTFPHKTSPAVATLTPFIDTSTPAINQVPVELDGVDTSSPVEGKLNSMGGVGEMGGLAEKRSMVSPSLGEEEDINEEFWGEKGLGRRIREDRATILASRSKDPGVIVDVPSEPTAEEVEAAKIADGAVTPGLVEDEAKTGRIG